VFYPKGFVPKHVPVVEAARTGGRSRSRYPPNSIVRRDGFTPTERRGAYHGLAAARAYPCKYQCLELIYPGEPVRTETGHLRELELQLAHHLQL